MAQEREALRVNVLLHVCCGPCASGTVPALRDEGIHPVLYWYNPNIHPFREYELRLASLKEYARQNSLPLVVDGDYGLRPFIRATDGGEPGRCSVCYSMRLEAAARTASEQGFDAFTTTLLVSPMQDRDAILAAGREASAKFNVRFLERDFRDHYRSGVDKARSAGLYVQKYCGCIFSEEERYASRAAKIKTGFFPNFPKGESKEQSAETDPKRKG